MFPRKRITILCILLLMLLPYGTVLAKGAPDKITITGSGLPDALEITDPEILEAFAMDKFVDFSIPVEEPKSLGTGYEITRYYQIDRIGLKAIDRFVYYPSPRDDGGYVFYVGVIDKVFIYGGSPHDGKWFPSTEEGGRAIRQIVAEHGIRSDNDSVWASLPRDYAIWLGYGGLVVVVSAVVFISYRKLSSRRMVT